MFIGSISMGTENEEKILGWVGERKLILMEQAFQLVAQHMPMQDPNTGQVGYKRLVRCAPVNNCLNPTKIRVTVEGIHFFSDMQEVDVNEHKKLVTNLERMLMEARLAQAGIVKPNMKGPSGPIITP